MLIEDGGSWIVMLSVGIFLSQRATRSFAAAQDDNSAGLPWVVGVEILRCAHHDYARESLWFVCMPKLRLKRSLRHFYPAVFIVELQSLLLCLLSCQVGEQVAHQGLFGIESAQIVLCTLDHQLQTCQWVTECLLQGL